VKKILFLICLSGLAFAKVTEIKSTDELSHEINNSNNTTFVDCYSTWCPPCKKLHSLFDEWSNQYSEKGKFLKVNLERVTDVPSKYNISSMPTLLIFDSEGNLTDKKIGLNEIESFFSTLKD